MTTIEQLKTKPALVSAPPKSDTTPSRQRLENRKLSAQLEDVRMKLEAVSGEKRKLEVRLRLTEAQLSKVERAAQVSLIADVQGSPFWKASGKALAVVLLVRLESRDLVKYFKYFQKTSYSAE